MGNSPISLGQESFGRSSFLILIYCLCQVKEKKNKGKKTKQRVHHNASNGDYSLNEYEAVKIV